MEIKQVIVVRSDLKMVRGKEDAQCGHAVIAWLACRLRRSDGPRESRGNSIYYNEVDFTRTEYAWLMGLNKKVTLVVSSEEELLDIAAKAKDAKLLCYVVEDEGLTQFNGVKTKTCLAIGPDESSKIDAITGHLRLR